MTVGGTNSCGGPRSSGAAADGPYVVSTFQDGTWRVVVAATTPVRITTTARGAPDLATHVAGGGFDFAFVDVPESVTNVLVFTGPDYLQGTGIARPSG